ncbi:MAG: PAS domain S-box protein [Elusimicrobia bacterium]|nr:PAS domain S-box protein [Elusimicrobiota bacterium]
MSRFADRAELEECLRSEGCDAAVVRLPDTASELRETLSRVRVASSGVPVIVVAPAAREEDAAAAVASGAADYWLESWSPLRLRVAVEQAAARRRAGSADLARDEALERVDDAVVVTDADERIIYWNRAATRLYGYSYAEVVGRLLTETLSPLWLDAETRLKAWRAVAARGVWLGEATHARADGAPVAVSVELSSVRDGRGRRAGLLLVARHAGPASAAAGPDQDPRDARRFLERILNAVADPIFVKDREHRMLLVNDALCALVGRPREEILGRTDADFLPAEQAAVFAKIDDRVFETGHESVNEEPITDAKGATHVLITKKTLARDADGRAVLVGVVRDVTEMMKAREDLGRSQEHLRHAQKLEAIGRLAGGVAHDFNNILTAIVGCAGILLDSLPPGHPCREEAEDIRRAGERASGLTRQLLAFSRREQGNARVVDLREVFGGMRKMLQRLLPAGIELDMPTPDRLACVRVDPSSAEQVLLNLIVNAGDAMPGGGRVTVRLEDAPAERGGAARVRLTVSDEGVGIDEATRARIFDPYFTTKETGTGIGLATVRDAVVRDGGTVEVDSAPGRGATFVVQWPACAEPPDAGPESVSGSARRAPRRASVLVVEDDDIVRRFSVRSLERAGYEVLTAADGAEALRISDSREGTFDVVVIDVVLPKLSGADLAARLRARQPTAQVLFVSGYRSSEGALPCGADGRPHFLPKPFTAEQLAERVGELVAAR